MKRRLGELLLASGKLKEDQLNIALEEQKKKQKPLGRLLVELGFITEQEISVALSQQMGVPYINLSAYRINPHVIGIIPEKLIRRYDVVAFERDGDKLLVAMADPENFEAIDDLKTFTKLRIIPYYATDDDIQQVIEKYTGDRKLHQDIELLKAEVHEEIAAAVEETIDYSDEVPIVKLVNSILTSAILEKASDIHIEPLEKYVRVRFRIHGMLYETMGDIPKSTHPSLISRIKVMASMDIAERRLPQDGRIQLEFRGAKVDFRVSVIPSNYGEKVVIRILQKDSALVNLEKLGIFEEDLTKMKEILSVPYGLVIVAGPTGSGKTTTLYAFISQLNKISKNIITLEDPIEYFLNGVTQIQILPKAGLTFASGLRSILRQDPDIIMVGETRDFETAQITVQSALTGHQVFTTIHTNDSVGVISRLWNMGVEPYLISSGLVAVVAQRLIRISCNHCLEQYQPAPELIAKARLNPDTVFKMGKGCDYCRNTGFIGRTGIYEILQMNDTIREMIVRKESEEQIRQAAMRDGMTLLEQNGRKLVEMGVTTVEELLRVIYFK